MSTLNCGRIAKFSDCRMKQGMDGSLFIMFLDVYKRQELAKEIEQKWRKAGVKIRFRSSS